MTRRAWIAAAAGLVAASALFADQAVVRTRDGYTYQGTVTETPQTVIVTIHGVETVIPKTTVESIQRVGETGSALRARLEDLPADDVSGRIALAREAFDKREYPLARDILENALAIDPNHADAAELLGVVQGQIRLERSRTDAPPQTATPPRPPITGQAAIERRLLTPADVEAIRRTELKRDDTSVRVQFIGDVKRRFAESQNMTFAALNSRPAVEQALMILDDGDETMRSKVRITTDPQSIMEFRRQIQPLVLANCATSGCHGGPAGGKLILLSPADSDLVTYTNFYILQSFTSTPEQAAGGIFGGSRLEMIDRGRGDQSLLANYGLPVAIAEYDHPPVNGKPITPIFRNKQDPRYLAVVDWMNNSLAPIEPRYGIRYAPPTAAEQAPATAPAQ